MRRLAPAGAILAVAALVAGAATAGTERTAEGQATVLAAASLTEVLPMIDGTARASFGGSNQLAQQARQGYPFDVFLSASPQYTQALFAEGLVRKPVAFATNSLVLIVPRRNPAGIATVADLARRAKLRLVVGGAERPDRSLHPRGAEATGAAARAPEDGQPRAGREGHRRQGRAR